MAGCVVVKELSRPRDSFGYKCSVAGWPRAPTQASREFWGQAGISLTWLTEGPPCPRGIRRFSAIVCSLVCENTESFSEFCRKGCGVSSVFRKLHTSFPEGLR